MFKLITAISPIFIKSTVSDNLLCFGLKDESGAKYFISFSVIIIVLGVISLFMHGLNLGIDFRGGSSIDLRFNEKVDVSKIKEDISTLGLNLYSIEQIDDKNISIVVDNQLTQEQVLNTQNYFSSNYNANTEIGVVSNVVKKELIKNALYSLLFACIGIIIYMSLRFKFTYAISGLVALFHDVFIIIAIFSLIRFEVSTIFIAAILSIIGYSINDTIVIFDRIRGNMKNSIVKTKDDLKQIVNLSLKQTITRSIITTITTLFPVIALIFIGSHEIFNFNVALLIGLIAGSYSSLFIASQLWYALESKDLKKEKKAPKKKTKKEPEELLVKGVNS